MAIPDFQTLMRPLLTLHEDREEHTQSDLRDSLRPALADGWLFGGLAS
jgi:restriction endonuclease Mrr